MLTVSRLLAARVASAPTARGICSSATRLNANDAPENKGALDGILNVLHQKNDASDASSSSSSSSPQAQGETPSISSWLKFSAEKQKSQDDSPYNIGLLSQHLTRNPEHHQIYIHASPNNTIITLARPNGSPLITTSGGSAGFKKAARSGYEAAHQAALQLLEKKQAKNLNIKHVHVILKGFGPGREAAYKALVTGDQWTVKRITDATPVPFGGCRPKKARRL
ncbi:hypothetical protein BX666DRAFT_1977826 [Dichotomocladium elegans]|nr:hypothetical protein BX666DRAFT_1977826 [Dichotomocladium elegans]